MGGMTGEFRTLATSTGTRRRSASRLHLWRFLTHPNRLASLTPSSDTLSRLVAEQVRRRGDEFVVELGAGTGAVTRALLASGVPASKLIAVEIDDRMARFLRGTYPDITVIEGDALDLARSLAPPVIGSVGTVICGIPASLLPPERQRELAAVMFSLISAGLALPGKGDRPYRHAAGLHAVELPAGLGLGLRDGHRGLALLRNGGAA
jgi:phosphatidylethanolamine/phosphatidyl-N-methylethanolamine N-methyltransferase